MLTPLHFNSRMPVAMIEEKRATKYKLAKVLIWRMSNQKLFFSKKA
jgi:hypothetical protein